MDVPAHYHETPFQRKPPEPNESVEIPLLNNYLYI
jgi:hypothetical protein